MNRMNRALLMLIAMVAIMITAVGIDRGYDFFQAKKWEEERVAVYEQARADIENMQATIQNLSKDPEALISYMEENELHYVEEEVTEIQESPAPGAEAEEAYGSSVADNSISGNSVSGNEGVWGSVSDNSVSGNSVSGNEGLWGSISGNGESGRQICASYEQTLTMNKQDKKTIAESKLSFSDKKIACLGDSITAGVNLADTEEDEKISYPYQLKEILGAKEVINLGIGGSSIGRYWENAFVDRYREIPEDTDIIIVMGGTNDGFCASEKELGSLKAREERTFAGDLDGLLAGLKEDYPDAQIILTTPLPNVLHDMLRRERDYLLPQSVFVNMMQQLAAEYRVPVIDLYHANLLDTHDAAVIRNFMPDGVHGNQAGYRILAEHMAAEIIRIYEE